MKNMMRLAIGAVMAMSPATVTLAKPDSPCQEAYGYYGYSSAYCEHNPYGRSTPADQYYGQNRAEAWRDRQETKRLADREQYSDQDPEHAVRNRSDSSEHDRDRG